MLAVYAEALDPEAPLAGLRVGEVPEPSPPEGWARVEVRAAALNHHDVWSLRGVGLAAERLPMILGCDAAGVDEDGNEVVVHALVGDPDWRGDETLDPRRTLLSERHPGTFAERVAVPRRNLVPKPPDLGFAEAACLPTAWLTAYRMLFVTLAARPGQTVLVQGAGGGVAGAAISLGAAAGLRIWATSRTEEKRRRAVELGAEAAFEADGRLPERVDGVIETVGEATWAHSLRSLRPGGAIAVAGATSGRLASTDLNRLFFLQQRILGSTMGTRDELIDLIDFCSRAEIAPQVDAALPFDRAPEAFARMIDGDVFGKLVLVPPADRRSGHGGYPVGRGGD
jgi:NADPH:quinone reductase-like Zn-dependent oxidoreductase